MKNNFSFIATSMCVVLAFFLPLFFSPFTGDLFDTSKRLFFLFFCLGISFLFAVRTIVSKSIVLTRNPLTLPLIVLVISNVLTILFSSSNKPMALLGNGGLYLGLGIFVLLGTSLVMKNFTNLLVNILGATGIIITILSLVDRFAIRLYPLINQYLHVPVPGNAYFFSTGSPLFTAFFLLFVVFLLGMRFLRARAQHFGDAVFALICLLGVALTVPLILPGQDTAPKFLSLMDSWSVATDVMKTPRTALFGMGSDGYANAFSIYKPAQLNNNPDWFLRFNNARNLPLEILVTHGLVGLGAWILLILAVLRLMLSAKKSALPAAGTLFILVLFLFFPPNVLFIGLLALFLTAWGASLKERNIYTSEMVLWTSTPSTKSRTGKVVAIGLGVLLAAASFFGSFGLISAAMGEFWFSRTLSATASGNGKELYDNAVNAIRANPYSTAYRRSFSQTNLALAQNISKKPELTEQEKNNVLTLVQQAIEHARFATQLDPLDTANWDARSSVYQELIGSAEGSEQWTIASYVEQIKTDPNNPQVRLDLAGAYRQMGKDDLAIKLLEQAIQLRPNYANAYFNLADVYRKKNDSAHEYEMLETTLALIKPEQDGYLTVKNRVDELRTQLDSQPSSTQSP